MILPTLRTLSRPRPLLAYFRTSTSSYSSMKVTVVGAAGKVGQPLCLMLKQSPMIDELCLYDIKPTAAFGMELNHVDTRCKVCSFHGKDHLPAALQDSRIVVVLAAAPGADVLTNDEMWTPNSGIVRDIVTEFAKTCPKALLAIGTNPVNNMVPMASEIIKKIGSYNPSGIFGITSLDAVRANTFVAQIQGIEPECVTVPVIGGHSADTIVPILSQARPCSEFTNEEIENITTTVRNAQSDLVGLKPGESGSLARAFAAARFVLSLVKAVQGYTDVVETAYVWSKEHPYLKYLATPLLLGPNGIMKNLGVPKLNDFEQCMFDNAVPILANDIKKGESFVGTHDPPLPCDPCGPPRVTPCPHDWCEMRR